MDPDTVKTVLALQRATNTLFNNDLEEIDMDMLRDMVLLHIEFLRIGKEMGIIRDKGIFAELAMSMRNFLIDLRPFVSFVPYHLDMFNQIISEVSEWEPECISVNATFHWTDLIELDDEPFQYFLSFNRMFSIQTVYSIKVYANKIDIYNADKLIYSMLPTEERYYNVRWTLVRDNHSYKINTTNNFTTLALPFEIFNVNENSDYVFVMVIEEYTLNVLPTEYKEVAVNRVYSDVTKIHVDGRVNLSEMSILSDVDDVFIVEILEDDIYIEKEDVGLAVYVEKYYILTDMAFAYAVQSSMFRFNIQVREESLLNSTTFSITNQLVTMNRNIARIEDRLTMVPYFERRVISTNGSMSSVCVIPKFRYLIPTIGMTTSTFNPSAIFGNAHNTSQLTISDINPSVNTNTRTFQVGVDSELTDAIQSVVLQNNDNFKIILRYTLKLEITNGIPRTLPLSGTDLSPLRYNFNSLTTSGSNLSATAIVDGDGSFRSAIRLTTVDTTTTWQAVDLIILYKESRGHVSNAVTSFRTFNVTFGQQIINVSASSPQLVQFTDPIDGVNYGVRLALNGTITERFNSPTDTMVLRNLIIPTQQLNGSSMNQEVVFRGVSNSLNWVIRRGWPNHLTDYSEIILNREIVLNNLAWDVWQPPISIPGFESHFAADIFETHTGVRIGERAARDHLFFVTMAADFEALVEIFGDGMGIRNSVDTSRDENSRNINEIRDEIEELSARMDTIEEYVESLMNAVFGTMNSSNSADRWLSIFMTVASVALDFIPMPGSGVIRLLSSIATTTQNVGRRIFNNSLGLARTMRLNLRRNQRGSYNVAGVNDSELHIRTVAESRNIDLYRLKSVNRPAFLKPNARDNNLLSTIDVAEKIDLTTITRLGGSNLILGDDVSRSIRDANVKRNHDLLPSYEIIAEPLMGSRWARPLNKYFGNTPRARADYATNSRHLSTRGVFHSRAILTDYLKGDNNEIIMRKLAFGLKEPSVNNAHRLGWGMGGIMVDYNHVGVTTRGKNIWRPRTWQQMNYTSDEIFNGYRLTIDKRVERGAFTTDYMWSRLVKVTNKNCTDGGRIASLTVPDTSRILAIQQLIRNPVDWRYNLLTNNCQDLTLDIKRYLELGVLPRTWSLEAQDAIAQNRVRALHELFNRISSTMSSIFNIVKPLDLQMIIKSEAIFTYGQHLLSPYFSINQSHSTLGATIS